MAIFGDIGQGLEQFGMDAGDVLRRLALNRNNGQPPTMPAPERAPDVPAPAERSAGMPGYMAVAPKGAPAPSAGPGNTAPPPIATPSMPTPGPAENRADAARAQGPPQLHGWKGVLDTIGQIVDPKLEQRIPGTPGHYAQTEQGLDKEATTELNQEDTRSQIADRQRIANLPAPTKEPPNPEAAAFAVLNDPNATPQDKQRAQDSLTAVRPPEKQQAQGTPEERLYATLTDPKATADQKQAATAAYAATQRPERPPAPNETEQHYQEWRAEQKPGADTSRTAFDKFQETIKTKPPAPEKQTHEVYDTGAGKNIYVDTNAFNAAPAGRYEEPKDLAADEKHVQTLATHLEALRASAAKLGITSPFERANSNTLIEQQRADLSDQALALIASNPAKYAQKYGGYVDPAMHRTKNGGDYVLLPDGTGVLIGKK